MNTRERTKLHGWVKLRDKSALSLIEVLSIQAGFFYVAAAIFMVFGAYSFYNFGLNSLPGGIFLGGLASMFGYLSRLKKNIVLELRYLDWEKVAKTLSGHNA